MNLVARVGGLGSVDVHAHLVCKHPAMHNTNVIAALVWTRSHSKFTIEGPNVPKCYIFASFVNYAVLLQRFQVALERWRLAFAPSSLLLSSLKLSDTQVNEPYIRALLWRWAVPVDQQLV